MTVREVILIAMFIFDALFTLAFAGFIYLNRIDAPGEPKESILPMILGLSLFFIVANGLVYGGCWLLMGP